MKVVGLAGSPRAWNSVTLRLVEAAVKGSGGEYCVIEAAHLNIRRCLGCGECYRTGRCRQDDDLAYLLERLGDADGIVLGSPVYAGGVTAPVETIMERTTDIAHCRRLEGKYGVAIAVSRAGDERFVLARLERFLGDCGVGVIGGLAVSPGSPDAFAEAAKLGAELGAAILEKRRCPEQEEVKEKFLAEFRETILTHKEAWAHDYRHWREKGWL